MNGQSILSYTNRIENENQQLKLYISDIYKLALECGSTFRLCRVGESHPEATKMREELLKPYNELAEMITRAHSSFVE